MASWCQDFQHYLLLSYTAKNTVISPDSLVWKFCGNSSKTMWKLCLSTKFPHQEIKWNYSIFRSVIYFGNTFRKWCTISGIWMFFFIFEWICYFMNHFNWCSCCMSFRWGKCWSRCQLLGNHFCHAHMLDASL